MEGIDRLFLNAGGTLPVPGEQPMIRQQKTAIDAARSAGVSRIVKISVCHAAGFADDVAVLSQEVASGSLATTTTAVQDLTGRPSRTFKEFLTANLDALRAALPSSGG